MGHLPTLKHLSEASLSNIRLIATDMDGTLTKKGKFSAKLLQAFEDLEAAEIKVLIITGRSAGWMSGISQLMPVVGAIAENGGLFYTSEHDQPVTLTPIPDLAAHRQSLSVAFAKLKTQFPEIQESADNRFRVTDWTFDVAAFSSDELKIMAGLCQEMGWGFTYSHVQCHIKPQEQNKAMGLWQVLREYLPTFSREQILSIGDSPNDESLFDPQHFDVSIGVANVMKYINQLQHQPQYITQAAEGDGFCELCRYMLSRK
ncbi:HAD family hydrolase [Nodularia harveyana UHCC-0300]|uniref:HAD family hydrolase n=1 Tax=Nodularia harveyana UHCC-0300 TaxID=2974287 RepID=A0ABU5UFR8_9CYAN|nr:HAD family hydrolase [Nodularia harveyana]MEA5582193.1 HAD family hydrolase [Nodularia harveyana UHCC-0300]